MTSGSYGSLIHPPPSPFSDAEKPDETLEYIEVYAASVESPDEKDTRSKKARELYRYLDNNRAGLLPYSSVGSRLRYIPS